MDIRLKVDWKSQAIYIREIKDKAYPHLVFTVNLCGVIFKGTKLMFLLPDDKTATIVVSPADIKGFAAPVEDLSYSSSDASIVAVDATGLITPVGLGTATINVTADAIIGDGVSTIAGTLDVQVVASQAVSLAVTATLA